MSKRVKIHNNILSESLLIGILYLVKILSLHEDIVRRDWNNDYLQKSNYLTTQHSFHNSGVLYFCYTVMYTVNDTQIHKSTQMISFPNPLTDNSLN